MPRLGKGPDAFDVQMTLASTGLTLGLTLDRGSKTPAKIGVRYLAAGPFASQSQPFEIDEWAWTNGEAGAGWSEETAASSAAGGYKMGLPAWTRRPGVAQPPGKITEVELPTAVASASGGCVFDSFEVGTNQDLWFTTSLNYMIKIPNGTDAAELVTFTAGTRTLYAQSFSGSGSPKVYVAAGQGAAVAPLLIFDPATSTWSQGEVGTERLFMGSVYWVLGSGIASGGSLGAGGVGGDRLLGINSTQTGFYHVSADPAVAANWSSLIHVGDQSFPIGSIITANQVAWFGTGNGVYSVNELGHSPNVTEWMKVVTDPLNGVAASAYHSGMIWFAHKQGLVLIPVTGERNDVAQFANFGDGQSNTTPIFGRPRTLAPSADGMFVAYYDDNGTSYVGHARLRADGTLKWSMPEAIVTGAITHMRQTSPPSGPRLWITTIDTESRLHLYYQDLPITGDPESDYLHPGGTMRYMTDWGIELSSFNRGNPHPKALRRFATEHRYVSGANKLEFYTAVDGGDYVLQGTATQETRWSSDPQADSERGVTIQAKVLVTNTETRPVILRSVAVDYTPQPEQTKAYSYVFNVSESVVLKNGSIDTQDPGVLLALLEAARDEGPLSMVDHHGRDFEGVVESVTEETTEEAEGFSVKAQVVISVSRRIARFDEALFDAAELFS